MKWRLSHYAVLASLLTVFISASVTASRGPATSVDDQRSPATRSRGSSRFSYNPLPDATSEDDVSTVPALRRTGSSPRRISKPRNGPESKRDSRPEAGLLEAASTKATVVAWKDGGRRHVTGSINEGIRPEESILGGGDVEAKKNARRNTRVSTEGETTERRNAEDRRYLPERRTRVRTEEPSVDVGLEAPRESSERSRGSERRISRSRNGATGGGKTLPKTPGPSVFASSVEYSRSRTGRKIQNPTAQVRNVGEEKVVGDRFGRLESRAEKVDAPKGRPVSRVRVSESDATVAPEPLNDAGSVRVDIPLTIDRTESPSTSTDEPSRSTSEPSTAPTNPPARGRGRSRQGSVTDHNVESLATPSRTSGRRGDFRYSEAVAAAGDVGTSSIRSRDGNNRGANSRSRNDSAQRSRTSDASEDESKPRGGRGRGRKIERAENIEESPRARQELDANSFSSRGREPERRTRLVETRPRNPNVEVERTSSRFGGRSALKNSETTSRVETSSTTTLPVIVTEETGSLIKTIELETTEQPEAVIQTTATTPAAGIFEKLEPTTKAPEVKSEARNSRGSAGPSTESRRRKKPIGQSEVTIRNEVVGRSRGGATTTDATVTKTTAKESFAPKLQRRSKIEGASVARTRKSAAGGIADNDDITPSAKNLRSDDLEVKKIQTVNDETESGSTTSRAPTTKTIPQRRGFKRLRIKAKTEREELSTASSINSEVTLAEGERSRRGDKSGRNSEDSVVKKPTVEATEEEDNYPPDFKARLAQLKNSSSKVSAGSKSTPRPGIQTNNFKKPSPVQFSTSARLKLEKAKKLVDLATDSEENELDVEKTTASPILATTQLPTPRKSLFGKRPRFQTRLSSVTKSEDARGTVETNEGNGSSFGKIRKAEKIDVESKISTSNGVVAETKDGAGSLRPLKLRPNFARRRSAPTTESNADVGVATVKAKPVVTDSKTLKADENSVSKYIRAGRISRHGEKPTLRTDSPKDSQPSKTAEGSSVSGKSSVAKRLNQRSTSIPNASTSEPATTPKARYTRRKLEAKAFRKFDAVPKALDEPEAAILAKREFRPRTATYRRHSEAPPSPVSPVESSTDAGPLSVSITPKSPQFRADLPITNTKTVNVQISENPNGADDSAFLALNGTDIGSGIVGSSNGESGNGATNVFNPTRTLQLMNRNTSLLEQLRSTVAPLLSSLGLKSPVFEGAYRNTTSSGNSAMRVTPSGQPPRFSARYKGAELFVRRPTNGYQPTVPSVVSSTTPLTPLQVAGVLSPLDVSSPGEPKVLTYYQALETASINNEQRTNVERPASAGQVVNDNARDINDTNNTNIDISAARPNIDSRLMETDSSSDTSETTVSMESETSQNPLITTQLPDTTTIASLDIPETTPSTAQPELMVDAILESTPNPETTVEAATESVRTETSPTPNEATSQTSDIPSTTLASDTNANLTPVPDTALAPDSEGTSSTQSPEPFERLTDATTVSSPFASTSSQNLETTTNIPSTETQQSSSETSQESGTDFTQASTVSSDVQTTQTSETTSVPSLRVQMQVDADASTPSAALEPTQVTPNPESAPSSESPDITMSTTLVADTPQTTPPVLARLSDSETPDETTVASSTQEPTTPSSLDITAPFGATTTLSQVTNQPDTEVTTPIIPTSDPNGSVELSTAEVTSAQSVTQSDTATTVPTTSQTFERIVEQGTESVNVGTSVTESEVSGSTVSSESGSLSIATDTPTQSTSEAGTVATTPFKNIPRIAGPESGSVDEDTSVTELDVSSSTASNQVGSVELEIAGVTSTQSISQSDTATTVPTTSQSFERIVEQETESVGVDIPVTESKISSSTVSTEFGSLPIATDTPTQSTSEAGTLATTPFENILRIAGSESGRVDGDASVTESDVSRSTPSNQVGSVELEDAGVTFTQSVTQSDTATTAPAITLQTFERIVEQETESVNVGISVTESEVSGSTVSSESGSLLIAADTSTQSTSEAGTLATTPFENILRIAGPESGKVDEDALVTESDVSSSTASNQVGSIELEIAEVTSTQSISQSDTATTTPAITTLQTFERIVEQGTESVNVGTSVTESEVSGSTASSESGSLPIVTDTPTQSTSDAGTVGTTPFENIPRIGELESGSVDGDTSVTESDASSSTVSNQVGSIELEIAEVTSTQPISRSDTTTTLPTTSQTFERIVEQGTESVDVDISVTEVSGSTASSESGSMPIATDTPTQSTSEASTVATTPFENIPRIGVLESESVDEDNSLTESDVSSSTASNQIGSVEIEPATVTSTQSISQSDTATTVPTTSQTFERIVEQKTESVGIDTTVTESAVSSNTASNQAQSLESEITTVTSTQSLSEVDTATTPSENLQQIVDQRMESIYSDGSSTTTSGQSGSLELGIEPVTSTQSNSQSDTTTTITITTQNIQGTVEQATLNADETTERDISNGATSTNVELSEDLSVSTTAAPSVSATVSDSNDNQFTTTVETPSESNTIPIGSPISESIPDTVSATTRPSLARIAENFETLTTVAPDTTTITIGEETTTSESQMFTTQSSSTSSSQLLGGFIDNRANPSTPSQETATQSTQTVPPSETTTPFGSLSDVATTLSNAPVTQDNEVVETTTTKDTTLTTSTLVTTETRLGNDDVPSNEDTRENDETGLTTNRSTANEVTTESISETSTTPEPTPNLVTVTPTLLARLQDVTATTTATVTAQGTAGVDVQATTRPNEISNNPETTPSPTTQIPTTPPPTTQAPNTPPPGTQEPTTSISEVSNDVSTADLNFPVITTTNLPDANEPTTVSLRSSADLTTLTEEFPATSTATATTMPTMIVASVAETTTAAAAATTTPMPETTFRIEENLISANAETTSSSFGEVTTTEAIQAPTEMDQATRTPSDQTTITTKANAVVTTVSASSTEPPPEMTSVANSESSTPAQVSSIVEQVIPDAPTTQQTRANVPDVGGRWNPFTTTPRYVPRFNGPRLTPAPRFSPSSSTQAPLRDYFVYGIYPNKTIVRKRPEDNIIDARNVDSPYVIFGIYPNGKLVRKFPNGTVIPEPPKNPVEVVFSLSTTTTNRPGPVFYNQANTGYYNQISPNYNNRPVASIYNQNANRFPGGNVGLAGNTITGNDGGFPGFPSVGIATNKMSDIPLGTQMRMRPNVVSEIGDLLTPLPNGNVGGTFSTTSGTPFVVTPSSFGSNLPAGGRISQERESDEVSRSRGSNGQRSSVYIGQDKFINYWSDNQPNTNPRVLSVRINSVAGSANIGPASATGAALPSLNILPGSQSTDSAAMPPGFPWVDPLDQIFGVTTNSPVITASVATNTLEDTTNRNIVPRPINPFVEVFTPVSSSIDTTVSTSMAASSSAALTDTVSTTTTTTAAPTTTTTTTTTTPAPTTTTTTPEPTTTTTTTTTTTQAPTTSTTPAAPSSSEATQTTELSLPSTESPSMKANFPRQTAFGTTFDDLAFLNALLQSADGDSSTKKTLTDAEQFLANKILSLALENVGPTRSPKAIKPSNASPNSFDLSTDFKSLSKPIVIDLLTPSTTQAPKPTQPSTQFTWRPVPTGAATSTQRASQATWKPVPVVRTTAKSPSERPDATQRPRATTTPSRRPKPTVAFPSQGFGSGILSALFGGNPFAPSPTPAPSRLKKPAASKPKPTTTTTTSTTPAPTTTSTTTTTTTTTQRSVQPTARPRIVDPAQASSSKVSASTPKPVTNGIAVLLNNPNPRVPTLPSSTFSPADDAKFLAALLNSGQLSGGSSGVSKDDEAFLRAILSGQANVKPASPIEAGNSGGNDAALLAALLQAQGIVPSTPANNLRAKIVTAATKSPPRAPPATGWSPSSTYPPSIFESFGGFRGDAGEAAAATPGDGTVRGQVVNAAIGATKAFSRFLGAAFTGAAQQFQSFVKNGTRYVSEAVG